MFERSWDTEESRLFGLRIEAARQRPRLTLEAPPPRASRAAAWLWSKIDLVGAAEVLAFAKGRYVQGEATVPGTLFDALRQCTKPFVLWNVERDQGPSLEDIPMIRGIVYKVGGAAGGPFKENEGMPGRVQGATKQIGRALEEHSFLRMEAFVMRKRSLRSMLTQDPALSGLGVPDDSPPAPPEDPPPDEPRD